MIGSCYSISFRVDFVPLKVAVRFCVLTINRFLVLTFRERCRPTQQSSQTIDDQHKVVVLDYKMDVSNIYNVERAHKGHGWRLENMSH